jgi:hypothetical protein
MHHTLPLGGGEWGGGEGGGGEEGRRGSGEGGEGRLGRQVKINSAILDENG